MKSKGLILLIILTSILSLVGCSNNKSNTNDLFVDQFAEPNKGEEVCEIVVKDYGSIYIRFFKEAAPKAVENFLTHAKNGYYDGLTFHRVIADFMIQGGDPEGIGTGGESIWGKPFEDEFNENLQPVRGALCMANSGPNSNGSQFFIVQSKESFTADDLEYIGDYYGVTFNDAAAKAYGELGGTPWLYQSHTVFGQVYEGLDLVDAIVETKVNENAKPLNDVVIESIRVFHYE